MALVTLTPYIANQVLTATQLNTSFNNIVNQVNGNLDSTNLANLAVTNAKIASGAVSGTKIAMGSDAQGDILYYNGSQYTRLGAGTSGQALITGGVGANPKWDSTRIVQVANKQIGSTVSGSTIIPFDDTVPTSSEGDIHITADPFTPTSSSNILRIDVVWNGSSDSGNYIITALFKDSDVSALDVGMNAPYTLYRMCNIKMTYFMTAGTTSAITFKLRVGPQSADTVRMNGSGAVGTRVFGGAMFSSITITEIKA